VEKEALAHSLRVVQIVVDNDSQDDTLQRIKEFYPKTRAIANTSNQGPAAGFNLAVAKSLELSPSYILVANSDTEVTPGSLLRMYEFLERHRDISAVTGRLYNSDGSLQKQRTSIYPIAMPKRYAPDPQASLISFVGTTFALIRPEAFSRIGGYDESYYFYNEDLDWSTRAVRAGLNMAILHGVKIIHHCGRGRRHNVSKITKHLYASNIYYFKRFYPRLIPLIRVAHQYEIHHHSRRLKGVKELSQAEIEEGQATYEQALRLMQAEITAHTTPRIPSFNF